MRLVCWLRGHVATWTMDWISIWSPTRGEVTLRMQYGWCERCDRPVSKVVERVDISTVRSMR